MKLSHFYISVTGKTFWRLAVVNNSIFINSCSSRQIFIPDFLQMTLKMHVDYTFEDYRN